MSEDCSPLPCGACQLKWHAELKIYYKYLLKTQKGGTEGNGRKEDRHVLAKSGPGGTRTGSWLQYLGRRTPMLHASISEHCLGLSKLTYICSFPAGIVEIQTLSSLFILLKTTFGLKILFAIDGERIYIQLTSAWKRRTLGLCGTFNGNIRDDFLWVWFLYS